MADLNELKEMDEQEAEDLEENEYQIWKQLKELDDSKVENKKELEEKNQDAVNTLIQAGKDELTKEVKINGVKFEILFTLDKTQRDFMRDLNTVDESKVENMDEDEIENVEEKMITLLDSITQNYGKEDWRQFTEVNGLKGLMVFGRKIITEAQKEQQEKMDVVKDFREEDRAESG